MNRIKQYFKIARTLLRRYTSPRYLHYRYYHRSFQKLFRFYMRKYDDSTLAAKEAMNAFDFIHAFPYDDIDKQFDELLR